ncbi:MAG: FecR domain-containing protein [Phycisphaeraceae bacterium]|nr:FecR domain-containing protein [Phycisphaeraceae bacterium]
MTEPPHELEAYFSGQYTEEQLRAIEAWINADPANAKAFIDQLHFREVLGQHLRDRRNDTGAILADLAQLEAAAAADPVALVGELPVDHADTPGGLSAHDLAEAGRYLFEHALANKRVLYTAGSALAAAVILIAAILWLPFGSTGPTTPADPLANTPLWDTPINRPVVAVLTDSVDARWRSDDNPVPMPMGAQLVAWERYTLTHGFAELTTRQGATVLLQAPCTIELTGSDNAIRLHAGKLVGRCLTPASKGFVVHTPGMDVVDLGTEFGVEADRANGSTVLVLDGSVRAQPTAESPLAFEPVVLTESQARRVTPETGSLEMIAVSEAPRFFSEKPLPYELAVIQAEPAMWLRQTPGDHSRLLGSAAFDKALDPRFGVLQLDGGGSLDRGDVLGFEADEPFSVGVWVRPESQKDRMFILGRVGLSDEQGLHGYDLYLKGLYPRFQLLNVFEAEGVANNSCIRVLSTQQLTVGQWQHVVATYDGSRQASGVHIYINGVPVRTQVADDTLGGNSILADTTFTVGTRGLVDDRRKAGSLPDQEIINLDSPMVGGVGDLVVFDRVISETEVSSLFRRSSTSYSKPALLR